MSEILDAWNELYAAQTEWLGNPIQANVAAATLAPCIMGTQTLDQILNAGGLSQSGSFEIQMRATDFNFVAPPKLVTPVTIFGLGAPSESELVVLDVKPRGAIYYITVGDATAKDA